MSTINVVAIFKSKAVEIAEFRNGHGFHIAIWKHIEDKYLPKLEYPRIITGDMNEIWELSKGNNLEEYEKFTMISSYDRAYCLTKDLNEMADFYDKFADDLIISAPQNVNHLHSVAIEYRKLAEKHDYRMIGAAVTAHDMHTEGDFLSKSWAFTR